MFSNDVNVQYLSVLADEIVIFNCTVHSLFHFKDKYDQYYIYKIVLVSLYTYWMHMILLSNVIHGRSHVNELPVNVELIWGVKRNNGVFIILLFLLKSFVIPLFLLKNFRYSIIPAQTFSLLHYSSQKSTIIPLIQEQNFCYSYSIIPLQPPKLKTKFHKVLTGLDKLCWHNFDCYKPFLTICGSKALCWHNK